MKTALAFLLGIAAMVADTPAWAFCTGFLFWPTPGQVVPPVASSAYGDVDIALCDTRIVGTINVHTSETVTAVQIHGPASTEENGPLLFDLPLPVGGLLVVDVGPVSAEQALTIRHQLAYLDVHSLEHPDGVLRGQILIHVGVSSMTWDRVKVLYR